MNPMIRKELRQRLRERRAWLLPSLYLLVLSGTVAFAYYLATENRPAGWRGGVQGADIGQAIFMTCILTQIIVLLLMAPVFSAGALTIEKEQRTLAGLLTSLLTPPQIWWGKFVAALLFLLLLLFSALPLLAMSFAFGGVEPLDVVKMVGSTILVLAAICAVGLYCSAVFRRSVHSTATAYSIVLVLSALTAVIFGILLSRAESRAPLIRGEGLPVHIEAWLWLNPLFPLLSLLGEPAERYFRSPLSSLLLYTALGCLAAAFAMRRIQRSGEQV